MSVSMSAKEGAIEVCLLNAREEIREALELAELRQYAPRAVRLQRAINNLLHARRIMENNP